MLASYWDESEAKVLGEPLLLVACYLARDEHWREFSKEWNERLLKQFEIPYFHAAELRSRSGRLYKHLDQVERRQLLEVACEITVKHVDSGFAAYMRPSDWKALTTANQRSRWGSAYGQCTNTVLYSLSNHVAAPERVSVFFERGHANVEDALRKVGQYRYNTEPIEWPEIVDSKPMENESEHIEITMRKTFMRIGEAGLVEKKASPPVQAADLWAYLAATTMSHTEDSVFHGALDSLVSRRPHAVTGCGPNDLKSLILSFVATEEETKMTRRQIYEMKKLLRDEGMRVRELPWGLVIDKGANDKSSSDFDKQTAAILDKYKGWA